MKADKNNSPLVSIIVPAYNVSDYIEECINSLLYQSYANIEIIIVDDGSTDGTGQACNRFEGERVKIIHKSNGGLVSARKSGLSVAKGEYVGFVDGDDYVGPDFVTNLVTAIVKNNADFVHANFCEVRGDNLSINAGGFAGEFVFKDNNCRVDFLKEYVFSVAAGKWITNSIWSKLYRKEFIQECYNLVPDWQNYGEDLLCLIYCLMKCNSLNVIEDCDYRYRIRETSMSHLEKEHLFNKELEMCNTITKLDIVTDNETLQEIVYDFVRNKMKIMWDKTATYYYPDEEKLRNKNIVLYGAGRVGIDYFTQLKKICKDLFFMDKDYKNKETEVYSIEKLNELSYDYILIAIDNKGVADEVKQQLIQRNVNNEKIIWMSPMKR